MEHGESVPIALLFAISLPGHEQHRAWREGQVETLGGNLACESNSPAVSWTTGSPSCFRFGEKAPFQFIACDTLRIRAYAHMPTTPFLRN